MEVVYYLLWAVLELLLYGTHVGLVVACCVVHARYGGYHSLLFPTLTLAIFCMAGWITNWFNWYRHEMQRTKQRSSGRNSVTALLHLLPSYTIPAWLVRCLGSPGSWTSWYMVRSLTLFFTCLSAFPQAFLQGYAVAHLWWQPAFTDTDKAVLIAAAVLFFIYSLWGVCGFIHTEHFEVERENLAITDTLIIVVALLFNMGGRVVSMAMVAEVVNWWWLTAAVFTPVLVNFAFCYAAAVQQTQESERTMQDHLAQCALPLPIAFLYSFTISQLRLATVITSVIWLASSLPQIVSYHETAVQWVAWGVPFCCQLLALGIIMAKWSIFSTAFQRFGRILKVDKVKKPKQKEEAPLQTVNVDENVVIT